MTELLLDAAGRCRAPATLPDFHAAGRCASRELRYPTDTPTTEIIAVRRRAGDRVHRIRVRRPDRRAARRSADQEALALVEADLDQRV